MPEYREAVRSDSWLVFAAGMIGIVGLMNVIQGIAAVSDSSFYVADAKYVVSSLHTWGWVLIVLGVIQAALAVGIGMRVRGLRWIGVLSAGLNAILQLVFMPAYPFWSLALFALNILAIYGLISYGGRIRSR